MMQVARLSVLLVMVAVFVPVAAAQDSTLSPLDTCPEAEIWWEETGPTLVQFMDIAEIAALSPAESLAPVLIELRAVEREYEQTEVPDCAALIAFYINGMMEAVYWGMALDLGGQTHEPSSLWLGETDANYALALAATLIGEDRLRALDPRLLAPDRVWGGLSRRDVEYQLTASPLSHADVIALATRAAYTPTSAPLITPTPTPSPTPVSSAETTIGTALVIDPAGAGLRNRPGNGGQFAGHVDSGATVEVLEGPRSSMGLVWWRIRSADGLEGWVIDDVLLFLFQ